MRTVVVRITLFVCCLIPWQNVGQAQTSNTTLDQIRRLDWQLAGSEGRISDQATLRIPKGHVFLGSTGSRRFLELQGNPPRDGRYVIAPEDLDWFGVFLFEPIGYVKDDEKVDPDELLEILKKQNTAGEEERRKLGLSALRLEGWYVPPHYDVQTKRLEWGTKLRDQNNDLVVNYTIKLLGRSGVMNAILVSEPSSLESDVRAFKAALNSYTFNTGERYTEFRSGDRVAEYGLAALVIGGAAAAAAKAGAFKGMAKLIGFGAIALGIACLAFLKRLFRRA